MSLVLMESADLKDASFAGAKWTSFLSGWAMGNTVDGRVGWKGRFSGALAFKSFPTVESATVVVGTRSWFGYAVENTTRELHRFGGSGVVHVTITHDDGGVLVARLGLGGPEIGRTAAGAYPDSQWSYWEIRVVCDSTAGAVGIWVDGNQVLNLTNVNTRNGGADALIDEIGIGPGNTATYRYVRDMYVVSDDGVGIVDRIGPVDIKALMPNGAGDLTEFAPTGAASNWQCVDDGVTPDGDTTYVSATAAKTDTYAITDLGGSANPKAVGSYSIATYSSSPLNLAAVVRRSSTSVVGTPQTPSGSYSSKAYTIWEADPIASTPWTLANFNATQFGIQASV